MDDIALLDRIQKGLPVSAAAIAHLRRAGLVEGRKPHWHVSAKVAAETGRQAEYMKKKELPGSHYRKMIIDYLRNFAGSSRKDINGYLMGEIRGELSEEEKLAKITNLLTYLRRKGKIVNRGTVKEPQWFIIDTDE